MIIADLHIHSHYSRATSKDAQPTALEWWARRKGIDLLGTGDFTHPAWRDELREKLIEAEEGLYTLREEYKNPESAALGERQPRFVLSAEISSIYKKNGRVRKVHNVILLPSLEDAEKLSHRLEQVGNLHSDGRPILGLDSRDLLEIVLECSERAIFIPAHIWTPHFSLFGAFSGFDTIEECFEDLTPYIHALETGLSSDPPMNWRLSALDRYTLVSNSDAHSPQKLGREANLLDIDLSYSGLSAALQDRGSRGFAGTIEFFPEEGKYHLDGHRACHVCLEPKEAIKLGGICPACGRKLTIGVLHRVEELSDREEGYRPSAAVPFESLVPLPEVVAAATGHAAAGRRVEEICRMLLQKLGPEFYLLRQAPLEDISLIAGEGVAEGIGKVRRGEVRMQAGYDGEYGRVQLFDAAELGKASGQISLFGFEEIPAAEKAEGSAPNREASKPEKEGGNTAKPKRRAAVKEKDVLEGLNPQQRQAAATLEGVTAVIAGPGTGKTRTLVARVAHLVQAGVRPDEITAVTFTNKAAREMQERLSDTLGKRAAGEVHIGTFHALCLKLIHDWGEEPVVLGEMEAAGLIGEIAAKLHVRTSPQKLLEGISRRKNGLPQNVQEEIPQELWEEYQQCLSRMNAVDYDDILLRVLEKFEEGELDARIYRSFRHLCVDEFQDINGVQYRLICAMGKGSESIFVIGDPDQSIYGFRGADAACFERLLCDFPQAQLIRLSENYRSTPEILSCALAAIRPNATLQERVLNPHREEGQAVRLTEMPDELSQGIYLAKEIGRMVGGMDMLEAQDMLSGRSRVGFGDIAVLYRTHRQAHAIEKCLRQEGIPYIVTGRESFLDTGVVKGIVGFFQFLLCPQKLVSLRVALKEMLDISYEEGNALLQELEKIQNSFQDQAGGILPDSLELLQALPEEFIQRDNVQKLLAQVEQYSVKAATERPEKLIEMLAQENQLLGEVAVQQLIGMAVFHRDMPDFLNNLAMGTEGDLSRSSKRAYTPDAVTLMTLHGSKGLEFPIVFLCGLQEDILPLKAKGQPANVEEERRLFYVGITRAKEELILLSNLKHPSPFLQDLPTDQLLRDMEDSRPVKVKQLSFF